MNLILQIILALTLIHCTSSIKKDETPLVLEKVEKKEKKLDENLTVIKQEEYEKVENELGITPELLFYKPGYLPGFVKSYDMANVWKKNGLTIHGMNYWTMGDTLVNKNYSERFNPDSKFYQLTFGIYVVHKDNHQGLFGFDDKGNLIGDDVFNLALSDQKSWLKLLGDPTPEAKLIFKNAKISKMDLAGRTAWKILCEMETHSDVSKDYDESDTLLYFQFSNPSLNKRLTSHLFHPHVEAWEGKVLPRHPVTLKGFYICLPFYEQKATVCIYSNGVKFRNKSNIYYDTFDEVKFDFIEMANSIKFKKPGEKDEEKTEEVKEELKTTPGEVSEQKNKN